MFYWCWIDVHQTMANNTVGDLTAFSLITLFLYYLVHFGSLVFSLVVVTVGSYILWSHLVASSETRKFVIKQNVKYVFVLAIETIIIIPIWFTQLVLLNKINPPRKVQFFTYTDFALAVVFAVVHSLRGTVDLLVWMWNFSIGPQDITNCFKRYKIKFSTKKELQVPIPSTSSAASLHLSTPLLITNKKDNLVNKALRRDAIYCINVGILESVQVHHDRSVRDHRVGSVRESFSAAALMELDQENQRDELALLYTDPNYREQVTRNIRFPASSASIKYFTFIDLEPTVFSLLRESYGITPKSYRQSFAIRNLADIDGSLMLERFTEGKSGSFFYFTQDFRFIIKTVSASEERFLRKIAHSYYNYMQENEDSLIIRFFGLHKIRLAREQRYISVVVMENVFYNTDQLKIHRKFDLKGSWVGRRSLKGNRMVDGYKGTLKDLDLGEEKILIGTELKEQLMEQLRKDVQFLTGCHIMDYSLLLGIHQHGIFGDTIPNPMSEEEFDGITAVGIGLSKTRSNTSLIEPKTRTYSNRHDTMTSMFGLDDREFHVPWFRQDRGGLRSDSQLHPCSSRPMSIALESNRDSMVNVGTPPVTYFFGVVDILQQYTLRKRLEHLWKTRVVRQDRHGLSAVNENEYGERFLNFLDGIIQ